LSRYALFRADASAGIGGGHIVRCLTLARALTAGGWSCAFACIPETLEAVPALAESGHEILVLKDGDWMAQAGQIGGLGRNWDLLIVDHYGLGQEFEAACRAFTKKILVIDDLANRRHDCDWLLDQGLAREPNDYKALLPSSATVLLGPSFALLRPQFHALRDKSLSRRDGRLRRVLVSFGAVDGKALTPKVLQGLADSGLALSVDVVLGSRAVSRQAVLDVMEGLSMDMALHVDEPNMAALMMHADLAISAGGMTSWERCTLGLPTLLIVTADNQAGNAEALADADAVQILGDWRQVSSADIAEAVNTLTGRPDRLLTMAANAARICDGSGVIRLTQELGNE
jgi:UDP-2,4-diacetamido-2,4,6-trideoxy-beta-L-altropyranose hydrolase